PCPLVPLSPCPLVPLSPCPAFSFFLGMHVIIQPRDGIEPLLTGIEQAQESVEIVIYRLDRLEIEQALVAAAARGVAVHALITHTNKENLKEIKKLEKRLAERRVRVTRTAEDLVRYHSKVMITDRKRLFLLTFNFTFLDIHHSRSFGVVTEEPRLVKEAVRIFEADALNLSSTPEVEIFVVSPINSREKLTEFILGAEKQLLIYDGKLSDAQIIKHLESRARAGVDIKVIGEMNKRVKGVKVRKMPLIRLHVQAIIRDGNEVFFGSQSLRKVELDQRREVGLITDDPEAVQSFFIIFEMDWGDPIA
ncbi:MAG: phospholipase D-like domain-containing protein, partial [Blastocatellia bacterium]